MALTANVDVQRKEGEIEQHKMAVQKIYQGALVKQNAAGFLANCLAESGAVFAGIAVEGADNSGGSAGDLKIRCYKKGSALLTGSGFAQTDVGQVVYATDENTITKTNANDKQKVGVISEYVSSTQVWVKFDCHANGLYAAIPDSTDAGSAITQLNLALAVLRKEKIISES
jgi:hypothetical protein